MAVVRLRGPLKRLAGDRAAQEVDGATVAELLAALESAHPAARVDPDRLLQGSAVPAVLRDGTAAALSSALHSVWIVATVLAGIGLALAIALEERPLRTHTAADEPMSSAPPVRHRTDDAIPEHP